MAVLRDNSIVNPSGAGPIPGAANPYSVSTSGGDWNYGVPAGMPSYAASSVGYEEPKADHHSDNGFLDNPASAGAPLANSNDGSAYYFPVAGPDFTHRPSSDNGSTETLNPSGTEYPSAQRLMNMPLYDRKCDSGPPTQYFGVTGFVGGTPGEDRSLKGGEDARDEINRVRNSVNPGDRRWVDRPWRNPVASNRLTSDMRPVMYSFQRPFDQLNRGYDVIVGTTRHFNGQHMSMADHRRNYPILQMNPPRQMRNTYRLQPEPWDANMADMPPSQYPSYASIQDVELPPPNRAFRLG